LRHRFRMRRSRFQHNYGRSAEPFVFNPFRCGCWPACRAATGRPPTRCRP
jgi:hypothetical protein